MIGSKSLAVAALTAVVVAAAAARGLLDSTYLESLSAASCIAVGLCASLGAALVGFGWRPRERSRAAVGLRGVSVDGRVPRELPAALQHALFTTAFVCIGLAAFNNRATARLTALPAALASPSGAVYCPDEDERPRERRPSPPPAEVPGCALVRRAYELGYADSLGSCAPALTEPDAPQLAAPPCTLRRRDEPLLHYGWRRLAGRLGSLAGADPVEAVESGADEIGTKLDHLDALIGHRWHAIAATRHASHHLWLNLPDPREESRLRRLVERRCDARYDALPLWRSWEGERAASALVDHVLGQLLFSPGFGVVPAQCGDLVIHWGAAADACRRLTADPAGFLAEAGALEPVRDVLDRRRRQIEIVQLDRALDRRATVDPPPDPRAIVSLQCLVIDPAATGSRVAGRDVLVDGQAITVRELRVPAVRVSGAGPLDVYDQLATLLAGGPHGAAGSPEPATPEPADLAQADYLFTQLERLRDTDPFVVRWPLEQADLVEVYPFHRHLHAFVDEFRRRYWAQRGRL